MQTFDLKPEIQFVTAQRSNVEAVVWNYLCVGLTVKPIDPDNPLDPTIRASWPDWLPKQTRMVQWDQGVEATNVPEGEAWCWGDTLYFNTPQGVAKAQPGDWIVRTDYGPFPVKAELFEQMFAPNP